MGSFWSDLCFCSNCCKTKKKSDPNKESEDKPENKTQNKVEERDPTLKKRDSKQEGREAKVKKVIIDPNSDQMSLISINIYNEEEETKQLLIDEEKLRKELSDSIKARDDSYGNVMTRQKSLSVGKCNEFESNSIEVNSQQFSIVKNLMDGHNYDIIESIGSGIYADVYKGRERQKQNDLAVKVIDLKQMSDSYGISFVVREVDAIQKLNHKNVIKVHQMITTDNKLFIVTELASNGSVADLISRRGAFTEFMSWFIFVSILEGLDQMHSRKIAHRNLKLENILLTQSFIPKISDFCLALIDDQMRAKKQMLYNLPYFAPEILQQLPYNPFISDIWSLGICLYIMVNDRLPFDLENEKEMLEKQLIGDWNFRGVVKLKLSKDIQLFISLMLEPDISLRPTTKQLLKHTWIQMEPSPQNYFLETDN